MGPALRLPFRWPDSRGDAAPDRMRWSRYYELIATGFTVALDEMKNYLERQTDLGRQ